MQSSYMYYPKIIQQGGNNFGSAVADMNDQRRIKPELFYQSYSNYQNEKSCSFRFLKAFSYLPLLPSSWSTSTRGAIGFGIFLFFATLIIVALGLIPVYLTLAKDVDKNDFSIDVTNGLKLQNQNLFGILAQTNEENRTLEQNITLTNEVNNLMTQLTARFRSLNPNIEKIYNIRLSPESDQSIDISYSIKTKPLAKSEIISLKNKLSSIINDQTNFNQLSLTNSTISVNGNTNDVKLSDPVVGEFRSNNSILLSNSKSSLKSDLLSIGFGIKDKKISDLSDEQKLIQSYSKIKFIKDDDDYIKKYPIYFPNYEPNYPPDEYQAYPEPYTEPSYPQEYSQYSEPKYQPDYSQKNEEKSEKYEKPKEKYQKKKSEHKKKQKSKLKEEKTVLKSETEKLSTNNTKSKLEGKKEASAEIKDLNESELDQSMEDSMEDSMEESTKKSLVKDTKKEEIKLKDQEDKLNDKKRKKNTMDLNDQIAINSEMKLKKLADEPEKIAKLMKTSSSTKEALEKLNNE